MLLHIVTVLLGTVCTSFGNIATDKPLEQTPDAVPIIQPVVIPIFQLKYSLSNKNIPYFISEVIIDHPSNYNLDTAALLNILNITEKNLSTLIQQVDHKQFLDVIGLKITDIVWEVSKYFTNRETLIASIQTLGIDPVKYAEATAYADQALMLKLLEDANFSKAAFDRLDQISGLTLDGIMQMIKPVVINAMAAVKIDKMLKELEDEMEDFIQVIFSNVTLSDVLNNQVLANIITNYTTTFNLGSPLVIPIGPNTLVTLMDAAPKWEHSKKYMDGYLVNIEDNSVVQRVRNIYTNCTYAVVEVDEINSSYFNRPDNYVTIPNSCVYITQSTDEQIEVRNVTSHQIHEYIINTDKVYNEIPQFGTPLICDNLVYALFAEDSDDKLMFITLHDDMPDNWDGFDNDKDNSGAIPTTQASVAIIFASILLIFS